jgi:glycosyltransferase involved in cell wall biosynthesis
MAVPDTLTILVPVFNEERTVASVVERLRTVHLPVPREIVVINDGSSDGTRQALDALPRPDGTVRIIHVERNAGKGAAIRVGLQHARGSITAIQDADLELDPAQLADLVAPILAGETQVVYGSRFLAGMPDAPWITVLANRTLTLLTNLLFGARITDMETCYKIMRTDVAQSLGLESNRFDIEPEITAKLLLAGYRILERPVRFTPRQRAEGKKIGWRDGVHALRVLARYRISGWRPAPPAPGA